MAEAPSVAGGRDRCSMAVGSRHQRRAVEQLKAFLSRSMLDGCGIETSHARKRATSYRGVAIDARWLWDRDSPTSQPCAHVPPTRRDRCSMAVGSRQVRRRRLPECRQRVAIDARWLWDRDSMGRFQFRQLVDAMSRSMLDGCGIETGDRGPVRIHASGRDRCSMAVGSRQELPVPEVQRDEVVVAIDARWLWDRDQAAYDLVCAVEVVAIDARWLWDRDTPAGLRLDRGCGWSRSMLDGCGIETHAASDHVTVDGMSRSMLDGCGIETGQRRDGRTRQPCRDRCSMAVGSRRVGGGSPCGRYRRRDRCSMAVGSRPRGSGCGGTRFWVAIDARWLWDRDRENSNGLNPLRCCRDRCSMAVGSRPLDSRWNHGEPLSSRSMLDGCGIETARRPPAASLTAGRDRCSMAVGSRQGLLKNSCLTNSRVAIDARWLWDRDLDVEAHLFSWQSESRSMLDGCGIETRLQRLGRGPGTRRRDRCSMAVGSRLSSMGRSLPSPEESRSMLDGCGIETDRR